MNVFIRYGVFDLDHLDDDSFHGCAGIPTLPMAESSHPLDPLSVVEISAAVATVRSAGATPEVLLCFELSTFFNSSLPNHLNGIYGT